MSRQGAGAGATRSRGPTCGDATVKPAKVRRTPAFARLRPPTRPRLRGDATQASAPSRRGEVPKILLSLSAAAA